ncbi:hypothetical protein PUN28_015271 [Cardiocondyla obscurior]|uniref:Uncharacterized protein n=1 Tax=Cardiocondyla obscurior TaxID=286306 RepID=A0AAW2F390_9HYME
MEKKVYCIIGERCKRVIFKSNNPIRDVTILREKLNQICNNDALLQSKIKNKEFILRNVDIDIANLSEINVLLLLTPSNETIPSTSFNENIIIVDTCNIEILQTEAIDFEIINKKYKNSIIIKDCKENILFEENININIVKSHDKESVNNQCMKDQHKFTTERSGCINFPTTFSALTYDLEQKLKTDGILKAQRYFISFWGQYLWQETHTKPTKLDYSNLAQSIVTAYPKLSGVRNGCVSIIILYITWIKNHRLNKKRLQLKKHSSEPKTETTNLASIVPSSSMTDADMTSAVKKLERKVVTEKNLSHVKRLLNQKLTVRRQWIENESDGINAIVKKYPPLQHYEMILYELLNMRIITEDRLFEKINFTMKILLKYCGLKEDNKTSKVQVLKHLNNLAHKKIKKKQTTLFTVKKSTQKETIASAFVSFLQTSYI